MLYRIQDTWLAMWNQDAVRDIANTFFEDHFCPMKKENIIPELMRYFGINEANANSLFQEAQFYAKQHVRHIRTSFYYRMKKFKERKSINQQVEEMLEREKQNANKEIEECVSQVKG